jgi:hypothetical protein
MTMDVVEFANVESIFSLKRVRAMVSLFINNADFGDALVFFGEVQTIFVD